MTFVRYFTLISLMSGNVGFNKSANMTADDTTKLSIHQALLWTVSVLVQLVQTVLFRLTPEPTQLSVADLGDVYKIYNITIYGRTDCKYYKVRFALVTRVIIFIITKRMHHIPRCRCFYSSFCGIKHANGIYLAITQVS